MKQEIVFDQLTQEEVNYVKRMVQGQKNAAAWSQLEKVQYQGLVERVKRGDVTESERLMYTHCPLTDPDTTELVSPPQVSAVPESV